MRENIITLIVQTNEYRNDRVVKTHITKVECSEFEFDTFLRQLHVVLPSAFDNYNCVVGSREMISYTGASGIRNITFHEVDNFCFSPDNWLLTVEGLEDLNAIND